MKLKQSVNDLSDLSKAAIGLFKERKTKTIAALEANVLENKKATSLKEPKSDAEKQKTYNQPLKIINI